MKRHLQRIVLAILTLTVVGTLPLQAQWRPEDGCQMVKGYEEKLHKPVSSRQGARTWNEKAAITELRMNLQIEPSDFTLIGIVSFSITIDSGVRYMEFDLSDSLKVNLVSMQLTPSIRPTYTHTNGKIIVDLGREIRWDKHRDILQIRYSGKPPKTAEGYVNTMKVGDSSLAWTLSQPYGARYWWPCPTDLGIKVPLLYMKIGVPYGYRAVSNGTLDGRKKEVPGQLTYQDFTHRYPIAPYLIGIAIGPYTYFDTTVQLASGRQMKLPHYCMLEKEAEWREAAKELPPMMALFEKLFGHYPFEKEIYGHTQWGRTGGMEHQTNSFMNNLGLGLMAHELGHQWFGDMVTCESWEDIWLNEGFATYCDGLASEMLKPETDRWEKWKAYHQDHAIFIRDGSVWVDDTTSRQRMFSSSLTYSKGAYVLHMLRYKLGDEVFFRAVRNYLHDSLQQYGFARTADLKRHMELEYGQNLDLFFQQWVYGKGYPTWRARWKNIDGKVRINLEQETSNPISVGLFKMPIAVVLRSKTYGYEERRIVEMQANNEVLEIETGWLVDSVALDPERWVLGKFEVDRDPSEMSNGTEIAFYPNPASNLVTIYEPENAAKQPMEALLLDLSGKIVYRVRVEVGERLLMDVSTLSTGMYLLQWTKANGERGVQKLVVAR